MYGSPVVGEPLLDIVHIGVERAGNNTRPRYVVIDKPSGMLSVPGKGPERADCVASRVATMFPDATGPLVVHRLDMDTSGLIVLGLDADAQRELSRQFERREIGKRYTAVVSGHLSEDSGVVDVPMRLDVDNRPVQIVDTELGKPSLTRWRVLERGPGSTRVELLPQTGRTHQLRVHMAHIGHPILGDLLYGPQPATANAAERLLLHAQWLRLREPWTGGQPAEFERPAPF